MQRKTKYVIACALITALAISAYGQATKGKITFPYTGSPIEITYMGPDHRTAERQFNGPVDKELARMLGNVKIVYNYVSDADYGTKMDLVLASGDLSDITLCNRLAQDIQNRYASSGNLLDYNKYLDYMPNYVAQSKKYPLTYASSEGSKASYAIQPVDYTTIAAWNLNVNMYYVNKYKVKVPTTVDELLQSLKQVKAANPNCYAPYLCYQSRLAAHSAQWFIGCSDAAIEMNLPTNTARVWFNKATKKWEYPLTAPGAKAMVAFWNTLYANGYLAEDFQTMTWEGLTKTLNTTVDTYFLWADFDWFLDPQLAENKKIDPLWDINFITPLTSQYVKKPVLLPFVAEGQNSSNSLGIATNVKTKNPGLTCAIIDFLNSDAVDTLINWGFEGKTYKVDPKAPYGGNKVFLPNMKYNANPNGTDDLAAWGVYGDTLRHQFSMAAGMKTGHLAQLYHDLGPVIGKQYAKDFDYTRKYPDSVQLPEPMPKTSADEDDQVTKIYTSCDTVITRNLINFVLGKRPMSEWDQFVSEVKKAGDFDYIVKLYNSKPRIPYIK
jgi:putative aldouronate transport system substrate-binding protein